MRRLCRILFSRYSIFALMILAELALLLPIREIYNGSEYVFLVAIPITIMAIISLINRNANPEYKVTWLIVIVFVPFLGTLLYILFSRRRISRREARIYAEITPKIAARRRSSGQGDHIEALSIKNPLAATKARAIINDDYLAEVCCASRSRYFSSGEEMYDAMLTAAAGAEKFIFLEYFIIEPGEMWDGIHAILKEKARAGVTVRVLYDDVGSMGKVPRGFAAALRAEGIECACFAPITPMATAGHNNRDHRKLFIVDGAVAFTGGINIADEYINKKSPFGHWRDGGIRISGDAVIPMLELFLTAWDVTTRGISDYSDFCSTVLPQQEADGGFYIPFGSGPSPIYRRPVGKNIFLNIINQAQSYVYITTPYLVIDFDLTESLRNAALRGVDVRIVTPGIADKKIVKIMTKSSYRNLMDAGVKIYEYTPGFIHEKTVVSDDTYAVIGTINFDYRSLAHHYENAVWMAESPTVFAVRDEYMKLLEVSGRIDADAAKLNFIEWLFKIGVRVFAPLL